MSEQFSTVLYEYGRYSPAYGSLSHTMPGIEILDEAEDEKRMNDTRLATQHKEDGTGKLTVDLRENHILRGGGKFRHWFPNVA